jgi:hypothetical protein
VLAFVSGEQLLPQSPAGFDDDGIGVLVGELARRIRGAAPIRGAQ